VAVNFFINFDKPLTICCLLSLFIAYSELVAFKGSHYSDPAFSWSIPIGITDIEFFKSPKLGKKYENNIFVGDINNCNIYFFKINSSRTGVDTNTVSYDNEIKNDLVPDDNEADNKPESNKVLFVKGLMDELRICNTGPDGYLYVLTYFDGKIYKIS
jgi:aldose sugar dehydrogenase